MIATSNAQGRSQIRSCWRLRFSPVGEMLSMLKKGKAGVEVAQER